MHDDQMSAHAIRLLLVDDRPITREPLARFLACEPDLTIAGQAGSLDEVRAMMDEGFTIDIAIVDLAMAGGVEIIRDLCAMFPWAEVVALTDSRDQHLHGRAIMEGASGIVQKSASTGDLVRAIRRLAAGEHLMHPSEAAALVELGERHLRQEREVRRALACLSPRECDVLRGLIEGMSNDAIADRLFVSMETVRTHVAGVLRKLGASSRLEAAVLAIKYGFGEEPDSG
jgi:two-component system, NarL family, response regulator DevR